jgi:hypothetical protein
MTCDEVGLYFMSHRKSLKALLVRKRYRVRSFE